MTFRPDNASAIRQRNVLGTGEKAVVFPGDDGLAPAAHLVDVGESGGLSDEKSRRFVGQGQGSRVHFSLGLKRHRHGELADTDHFDLVIAVRADATPADDVITEELKDAVCFVKGLLRPFDISRDDLSLAA